MAFLAPSFVPFPPPHFVKDYRGILDHFENYNLPLRILLIFVSIFSEV